MSEESPKNDTVGLFLRAMVDREPGKRKVKPSKTALIDLAELDLGESSDDSDFNVDEAKLKDDDDVSINSDIDDDDDDDDDNDEEDDDDENSEESNRMENKRQNNDNTNLSVKELIAQAEAKQALSSEQGIVRPKILVCAICLGEYSDDFNEIVTCDGCHVSVHEGCYGISDTISVSSTVSSSSTEPWFCDVCKAGVSEPSCELCPNLSYTIFKETEMGRWVHLVCALYIPGVAFSEVDKLSFPTLFEMPYSRYGAKTCSLCEDERFCKTGVCIGCDAGMCRAYFHVTCAQREGLLSEVNHCEADQADPYYAHCKLHTDRELMRRRRRNWLALQIHMKQGQKEKLNESQEIQDRLQRKLVTYREKYMFTKSNRPPPWFPTQKMPRPMSTCASLFRSLLHKTSLMGVDSNAKTLDAQASSVGDIRKKWHISPAFSVEFISYYLDRTSRMQEMKSKLTSLITENEQLMNEETKLRNTYNSLKEEHQKMEANNNDLLNKSLEIHDLLKGLAGRPLRLPPVVAALHNPPCVGIGDTAECTGKEKRLITKAATKMMSGNLPILAQDGSAAVVKSSSASIKITPTSASRNGDIDRPDIMKIHVCSVCKLTKEQHLLIQCDTCVNYYHLSCLDPPLTRMPKKTKQMGWQCSDCCKSSDSDKTPEVDMAAPRRLRRNVKEPVKFSPTKGPKQEMAIPTLAEASLDSPGKGKAQKVILKKGVKRRNSADSKKTLANKVRRRSADTIDKSNLADVSVSSSTPATRTGNEYVSGSISVTAATPTPGVTTSPSVVTTPITSNGGSSLDISAESLPSPTSESFPSEEDPSCPKKERRHHKEGGKKKKKDKDKDEGKKRKKHHHRDRYPHSEMMFPFRIKIKPLPPRPSDEIEEPDTPQPTSNQVPPAIDQYDFVSNHTTTTTTAPPGYPPLPPGYTLTQPMMMHPSSLSSTTQDESKSVSQRVQAPNNNNATNSSPTPASRVSSVGNRTGSIAGTGTVGRRKSDSGAEQFSTCDVCGETGGITNTVICDECLKAYHFNCLDPPLKKSPKRRGYSWFCEDCDSGAPNTDNK